MSNKRIEVQLSTPERYYTRNYHDFMDCRLLTGEEKIVFLALKRFLDVRSDEGEVFPAIERIQNMTSWGKRKVINQIKNLENKGVVKKIRRGQNKPNLYILSDYATMWTCDSVEEMEAITDSKGERPLTAEEHIAELQKMGYKVNIEKVEEEPEAKGEAEEKEPVSGVDQTTDTSTCVSNLHNDTTEEPESQECSTSEAEADALLDRLWVLYPVKKGKGQISVTQKKKLLKIGYDEMARAIERYKQYVESVDYLHYQNGSTFFNGGYIDYLDANYDPESEREARNSQKKSSQTKNKFNDYPTRDYDFDAIKRGMFDQ